MDPRFWHDRWETGRTNFHEGQPNAFLVDYIQTLNLPKGARIFLPLCGKTRDIAWLLSQGFHVVGAELSAIAIDQLFADLDVTPDITQHGTLQHRSAPYLDIYVGDIFDLTPTALGQVDATFDRAALVALPADMRDRYAQHIVTLTQSAPQLLVTFQYDEALIQGPPFAIPADQVKALYGDAYTLTRLARQDTDGGLKGHPATEELWHLSAAPAP